MTPRLPVLAVALLLCAITAPRTAAAQASSRAREPITSAEALVTFDSAWSRIGSTHYDTAMRGVDWQAVRDSLRPVAARATTLGALRETIARMLATLGESHFVLIPQEAADGVDPDRSAGTDVVATPGDVGITLRLIGDTVVVSAVRPGGPAALAGVEPGWALDSVGRFGAASARASVAASDARARPQALAMMLQRATSQLAGAAGAPVHAAFTDHHDRRVATHLVRSPMHGTPVRFGNLPAMFVEVAHTRLPLVGTGGCAGVIRLSVWMLPATAQLDSAVDAVRDCEGIIVDLRGNPGGVGGMIMAFGGHFLDSAVALGELRTRSTRLRFVTNPRRANVRGERVVPFAGPLAIVVDPYSMSTSEIFAAGMQAVGRARVFGEATPGLALPAVLVRLPTGDVLMHVFADFTDPTGRRIEGTGVVPDERVPLDRGTLRAGVDAPVAAAARWIATEVARASGQGGRIPRTTGGEP